MRRIALIFLVAVFVPSLALGLLALRTAGEQRMILERQASELYQKDVDHLASELDEAIIARQRQFADQVRLLLSTTKLQRLASDFGNALDREEIGAAFVVAPDGTIVSTQARSQDDARFLRENDAFLNNRAFVEFFPTQENSQNLYATSQLLNNDQQAQSPGSTIRKVQPQKNDGRDLDDMAQISRVASQVSNFEKATSDGTDGVLARFTRNELTLILWTRPPEAGGYVFGLALPAKTVTSLVQRAFATIAPEARDACLAVLDEKARPIALSQPGFKGDWKRPFVASEIGETLPHWEVALYLLHPDQLVQSARFATIILVLLIAVALAAILAGGCIVAIDARRQLVLAQKKTDFVSNVSHELKTPLTSIQMFAELLEQGRIDEPEKRSRYLRIIVLESERLTRLINNALDFARLEKKRKPQRLTEIDLHPVIQHAWETQTAHWREEGFACEWIAGDPPPYLVVADADAIGQVLVNLLSNAAKYSADRREMTLHVHRKNDWLNIEVMDRGIGIASGEERRIFEAFHRSNDSLASTVQGSGLGLTLAQRIAQDHGGDIDYRPREGGGSIFILRLPLAT